MFCLFSRVYFAQFHITQATAVKGE